MSEFEQLKLKVEYPNDPVSETAEQGELYPGQHDSPFWLTAKDIRIGRIGLYHARLALNKPDQNRSDREQTRAADRSTASPFPQ